MIYTEIRDNLFSDYDENTYFMQCISADFGCGKGIAVQFNKYRDVKNILQQNYPNYVNLYHQHKYQGSCILANRVFNLITKERYWEKPTYESIKNALLQAKTLALQEGVDCIKLPRIGCGLDRLEWDNVSKIMKDIFSSTDISIEVYFV